MSMHHDPRVRIIGRRTLWDGFIHLEEVTLEQDMSNGVTATLKREVHDHGSAATILLVDTRRQSVVLVRQLRIPVLLQGGPAYMIEAVAGCWMTIPPKSRSPARHWKKPATMSRAPPIFSMPI